MKTYILFLSGDFNDFEDIEFFCVNVFGDNDAILNINYLIQNLQNIIIIFDCELEQEKLNTEIAKMLDTESTHYYFLFNKSSITYSYLPEKLKDIIFKHKIHDIIVSNGDAQQDIKKYDLNTILEKINKNGISSLTKDEKNYLDNFDK